MQFMVHEGMSRTAFWGPLGEMDMARRKRFMVMRHDVEISFRPDEERDHCPDQRQHGGGGERHPHATRRSGLARKRISDQPTHMAERELRSEQGGAIHLSR